jgi:putative ABC transport system ATP-binding protein
MSSRSVPADARVESAAPVAGPVVSATNLVRRYGEGDTAVEALRSVSLDVADGRLTAIMGPRAPGNRR